MQFMHQKTTKKIEIWGYTYVNKSKSNIQYITALGYITFKNTVLSSRFTPL